MTLLRKSLLTSLYQREAISPLWQRGVRGDFMINQASLINFLVRDSGFEGPRIQEKLFNTRTLEPSNPRILV